MSSMTSTPSIRPYFDELGRTDAEIYLTDIYDGKIIASRYMHKLADMMLPRFHEEYHGYHYDADRGIRVCKFLEKFCVIPEGEKMGQPFILEQFQRAVIEMAYGFVDENDVRQFMQAIMEVSRKNGKTALMAGLALYHLTSDGENGAEVYLCATSETQARKCYGAADSIATRSRYLKNRIRRGMAQKTGRSALNYDKNGSMMYALAANPKKRDGLSASAVIYDELAAAEDGGALFEQLEESMTARKQPFLWVISSENTIRDGIWDERLGYCQGILNGTIEDDTVLPLLYTQDDRSEILSGYEDESHAVWMKSNPGLYTIKDANKLARRVNQARQSPRRMPSVLTKEFCLRSGTYSAFLDIDACVNKTPINFDEMGIPPYVVIGFDLATKNDLCACICRWMVPGDNRIYEIAKFWVASDYLNMQADYNQKDRVPYLLWSSQGQKMGDTMFHYVDIVEGDRVNQMVIIDFLRDLVDIGMYPFCIGYDSWHVDDWTDRELHRLVGDSRVHPVPQTARVISPLLRTYELDLKAKLIICDNPCLHHSRQSVEAREDNGGNLFPRKKDLQKNQKIDGAMAELFALSAFNKYKEEYLSAIEWYPPEDSANETARE